jgi:hypothetical protein
MVKIAKLKTGFKKIYISESIFFEASTENTKTSSIVPPTQIEYIYDIEDGKVVKTKPGDKKTRTAKAT